MISTLTNKQAYRVLNALPGLGANTVHRLLEHFSNPINVLAASIDDLQKVPYLRNTCFQTILNPFKYFDLYKEEALLDSLKGHFLDLEDAKYPFLLSKTSGNPIGLYILGHPKIEEKSIAIVGSRKASFYGMNVAKNLSAELARLGFCIVSGLARGIDTAAHEGALSVGGRTVAVLGCGVDLIYPPENKELYHEIVEKGTVLSEFCLGHKADRYTFPMRNRIISGLSKAVLVVETHVNGGSMITARLAGEQGRSVLAVPGLITNPFSHGCHMLIREGATLVQSVDHILEEILYPNEQLSLDFSSSKQAKLPLPKLGEEESNIFKLLKENGPLSMDAIAQITGSLVPNLNATLMSLELKKAVTKRINGCFEANF